MYLVELRPGKEELYRSSEELALAIRNGDVDARSRVYHRATAKWISITLHPQYKAIVTAAKDEPGPRPARRAWGLLGGSSDQPVASSDPNATNGVPLLQRWRRPLALGISSILLLSGLQLASSGPRPPWAGDTKVVAGSTKSPSRTREVQREKASQASALVSLASNTSEWPEESASADTLASPAPAKPANAVLPRAPKLRSKSLHDALAPEDRKASNAKSPEALVARYSAAHDSVYARLESGMRVARLHRLFAPARLSPGGGVTDTRMSLAGAANFIRVYRQQQNLIEQAYQDTVTALARQYGWSPRRVRAWYSRTPRKEAASLELLSGALLSSVDSVLGVLNAQAGAYKIRGTAIAFEDPAAGQAYGALRRRIKDQIDAAIAAGGGTSRGPAGLLLQAIGTTSLPRET